MIREKGLWRLVVILQWIAKRSSFRSTGEQCKLQTILLFGACLVLSRHLPSHRLATIESLAGAWLVIQYWQPHAKQVISAAFDTTECGTDADFARVWRGVANEGCQPSRPLISTFECCRCYTTLFVWKREDCLACSKCDFQSHFIWENTVWENH
jgi:hypothetical protein